MSRQTSATPPAILRLSELNVALEDRGFESPYLKPFLVARINRIRFKKGEADFDETLDKMLASARKFDAGKVGRRSGRPIGRATGRTVINSHSQRRSAECLNR